MFKKVLPALCLIALVSAAPAFPKKIEITFWHSLGFHVKAMIDEMAAEYNKSHPEVQINPVFQGSYDEMQVKMLASAVTRQLPDIAQVQFEFLESYIANGLIEPINSMVSQDDRDDILDILWKLPSRGTNIYGVPFLISTEVLFYNQDAFIKSGLDPNKPPETWEDIIRMGKKLTKDTDGDGEIDRYAMMFWTEGFYGLAPFLWAYGGELFSDDGKKVILTSSEMRSAIALLRDLAFKYRIMPYKWSDWEAGQAFLTGKLAMGIFTSAAISYGEQNLPWKLGITHIPSIDGRRYTIIGGSCFVNFSRNKKVRKLANDFIFWAVSKENTIKLHEKIGFVPVRKSALGSLELKAFWKENPNYKVPVDAMSYGHPLPDHPEYFKINKMLREMLERIFLNENDPGEELARTEQEINASIR